MCARLKGKLQRSLSLHPYLKYEFCFIFPTRLEIFHLTGSLGIQGGFQPSWPRSIYATAQFHITFSWIAQRLFHYQLLMCKSLGCALSLVASPWGMHEPFVIALLVTLNWCSGATLCICSRPGKTSPVGMALGRPTFGPKILLPKINIAF